METHTSLGYVHSIIVFVGFLDGWCVKITTVYVQPIRISDLKRVDAYKACEYFSNCFKDPSTFTVVIVGNLDPATARPLILQYLVSRIFSNFQHS